MFELATIPLLLALAQSATEPINQLPEVVAYRAELDRVRQHAPGASVAAASHAADVLSERLMKLFEKGRETHTLLEVLSAEDHAALQELLGGMGMAIQREEVIFARKTAKYFSELAAKYGGPADIAFFKIETELQPDSGWPIYTKQQTDYSGCTDFASGTLVKSYDQWRAYRAQYPDAYAKEVEDRLADIEGNLTNSTCACGDAAGVEIELHSFIETFPDSPVFEEVRQRLRKLHDPEVGMRFDCISG